MLILLNLRSHCNYNQHPFSQTIEVQKSAFKFSFEFASSSRSKVQKEFFFYCGFFFVCFSLVEAEKKVTLLAKQTNTRRITFLSEVFLSFLPSKWTVGNFLFFSYTCGVFLFFSFKKAVDRTAHNFPLIKFENNLVLIKFHAFLYSLFCFHVWL